MISPLRMPSNRIECIGLLLAVVGIAIARIALVSHYPIHEDELISLKVMSAIVETGKPLVNEDVYYWRSVVGYYVMAVPLFFMSMDELSLRLVTILCSSLVLLTSFAVCRSLDTSKSGVWCAWFVVLFLGISAYENLYASFSRFYMPFQFFFMGAVYFAGKYFISRKPKSGYGLILFALLSIGTHRLSLQLFFVFLIAWAFGGTRSVWRERSFWAGGTVLLIALYVFLFWHPAEIHWGATAAQLVVGGLEDKWAFFKSVNKFIPLGWALILIGFIGLLREKNKFGLFLWASFGVCFVTLSLAAPGSSPRYMAHLFPLGVVLALFGVVVFGKLVMGLWTERTTRTRLVGVGYRFFAPVACLLAILCQFVFAGFSPRQAFGTEFRFIDQKPAHERLAQNFSESDVILSTDPPITKFYVGNEDAVYFLREHLDPSTNVYGQFAEEVKRGNEEYFIDCPERLQEVLRKNERIWLYASWKYSWAVSEEMKRIIRNNFRPYWGRNGSHLLVRPERSK